MTRTRSERSKKEYGIDPDGTSPKAKRAWRQVKDEKASPSLKTREKVKYRVSIDWRQKGWPRSFDDYTMNQLQSGSITPEDLGVFFPGSAKAA